MGKWLASGCLPGICPLVPRVSTKAVLLQSHGQRSHAVIVTGRVETKNPTAQNATLNNQDKVGSLSYSRSSSRPRSAPSVFLAPVILKDRTDSSVHKQRVVCYIDAQAAVHDVVTLGKSLVMLWFCAKLGPS